MMKRTAAMILAMLLMLTACVSAAMAEDDTPMGSAGYYYVYTENGKGLNVRSTPGGQVVGSLKYGTRVYCYYKDGGNGWALIDYSYDMPGVGYGTYACYISSRFLVRNKPAARNSSSGSAASQTSTASAGGIQALNKEYRSAKKVTPFKVTVRPSRVSGWVNMRWAPSKETEVLATYRANQQLLVIEELDNWYQVEDQDTGSVGFVSKQYVTR